MLAYATSFLLFIIIIIYKYFFNSIPPLTYFDIFGHFLINLELSFACFVVYLLRRFFISSIVFF